MGKHGVPRSDGWLDIADIISSNVLTALGGVWVSVLIFLCS